MQNVHHHTRAPQTVRLRAAEIKLENLAAWLECCSSQAMLFCVVAACLACLCTPGTAPGSVYDLYSLALVGLLRSSAETLFKVIPSIKDTGNFKVELIYI